MFFGFLSLVAPSIPLLILTPNSFPTFQERFGFSAVFVPTGLMLLIAPIVWTLASLSLKNTPALGTDKKSRSLIRAGMYCAMGATIIWTVILLWSGLGFLLIVFGTGMKA